MGKAQNILTAPRNCCAAAVAVSDAKKQQFQSLPVQTCGQRTGVSSCKRVVTQFPIPNVKVFMNGMPKNAIPATRKPETAWAGFAIDALFQVAWLSVR